MKLAQFNALVPLELKRDAKHESTDFNVRLGVIQSVAIRRLFALKPHKRLMLYREEIKLQKSDNGSHKS